jgi:uncharacterized protein YbaR (Trm112 family)
VTLIDPSLADVLVCPVDKAELRQDEPTQRLVCTVCDRRYPVRDGIPIMLVDQAEGGPDE